MHETDKMWKNPQCLNENHYWYTHCPSTLPLLSLSQAQYLLCRAAGGAVQTQGLRNISTFVEYSSWCLFWRIQQDKHRRLTAPQCSHSGVNGQHSETWNTSMTFNLLFKTCDLTWTLLWQTSDWSANASDFYFVFYSLYYSYSYYIYLFISVPDILFYLLIVYCTRCCIAISSFSAAVPGQRPLMMHRLAWSFFLPLSLFGKRKKIFVQ